jgi:membrane protein
MTEIRREGERRARFKTEFALMRQVVWSWLTDPAVLLYRREAHGRKRARVTTVEFFLFLREVTREFYDIEGTSRAASLAYTTLLSLIPLLVAFTQALQRYFRNLFPNSQAQIDNILNNVIPYQSPVISYHIAKFAENAQAASTFGVIIFIVITFRLFLAVEATINQIWKVRSVRGYRPKIIAFTMLFFWGPVLMAISFTTTSTLEKNRYLRVLFQRDIIFTIAPVLVLFIAFTMLFWLVPATRVRFSSAAVGAIVTTALFTLIRFGFGIYADHLIKGRFNLIYGAGWRSSSSSPFRSSGWSSSSASKSVSSTKTCMDCCAPASSRCRTNRASIFTLLYARWSKSPAVSIAARRRRRRIASPNSSGRLTRRCCASFASSKTPSS